jgi:hypothetical protein
MEERRGERMATSKKADAIAHEYSTVLITSAPKNDTV